MNLKKVLGSTIVALAFAVLVSATTQAKDSRDILIPHDASLAGSHFASGRYHMQWETHIPSATVTFVQRNKVVATAEGKVVDRGKRYPGNEVVTHQNNDGSWVIDEIRLGNSSEAIVFQE